jgi:hypothetical protein
MRLCSTTLKFPGLTEPYGVRAENNLRNHAGFRGKWEKDMLTYQAADFGFWRPYG